MKKYKIWVCHQIFTGKKRTIPHYWSNGVYYDDEYETEITEWKEYKIVNGIRNLYNQFGYNRNFVNTDNFSFQKKWYNESLAFRNKFEKKYYDYLRRKKTLNEMYSFLSKDKTPRNDIISREDFKIKFDFLPRDNLKGKIHRSYYCITDEDNYLIDYNSIIEEFNMKNHKTDYISCFVDPFKKASQSKGYTRYGNYHWGHPGNKLCNEMKQSVTPQEIEDTFYDYGIRLKPYKNKRYDLHLHLAYDDFATKHERNWKKFRKHQWKVKSTSGFEKGDLL